MLFWIIALALSLMCAAILARAILRGRPGDAPPAAYDLKVYRDQLKEVDRDLARGVITVGGVGLVIIVTAISSVIAASTSSGATSRNS